MRRLIVLIPTVGLLVALLAGMDQVHGMSAQEIAGTPGASGVTFEPVAGGVVAPAVSERGRVRLEWADFAPGASYTVAADDPSLLLCGRLTRPPHHPLVGAADRQPGNRIRCGG